MKIKNIKIAIDSPAGAGAGTQSKLLSKHYNLFYLDTGKFYRILAYYKIKNPKKFNLTYIKAIIKNIKLKDLNDKKLLSNEIGMEASIISKNIKIRKLIDNIQRKYAYKPPEKYNGSCLDGRDITYKILPDADFKFFLTADIKTRAKRRYKELKKLKKQIKYIDVLNSIKKRDQNDYKRKISPLKRTKDSILIDTTNLSIKGCFKKIKNIIDKDIEENNI
ncbi:(d)CMP kinase [Candidatus Pelagibacter sp.]|nr:(d)CMP kinase [Candidatus Pelagibacter sp.]